MVPLRDETPVAICAALGCPNPVPQPVTGRPGRYCGGACRSRAHRQRQRDAHVPVVVEVDHGSTSSKGRRPGRVWIVRLRREGNEVILAIGLSRHAADRLAERITDVLGQRRGDSS